MSPACRTHMTQKAKCFNEAQPLAERILLSFRSVNEKFQPFCIAFVSFLFFPLQFAVIARAQLPCASAITQSCIIVYFVFLLTLGCFADIVTFYSALWKRSKTNKTAASSTGLINMHVPVSSCLLQKKSSNGTNKAQ